MTDLTPSQIEVLAGEAWDETYGETRRPWADLDPSVSGALRKIFINYEKRRHLMDGGTGLSARERAAIQLRVPTSGNPWLDKMITEARKWDAAQAALAWLPHTRCGADLHPDDAAAEVIKLADALTRQMKGGAR